MLETRRSDYTNDPYEQYVWDARYIDAPVLRWQDANDDGDVDDTHETLYVTTDANMNVTALVDTSGTVLERVVYDPYGNPTFYDGSWTSPAATSSYDNVVLYCGYRWDGETGLYHVRHRMYHATLGRWIQRDPIGYEGGPCLYAYVGSQPLSTQDPSGLIDPDIALPSMKSPRQQQEEDAAFEYRQKLRQRRDSVEDFIDCEHLSKEERNAINDRVGEACRVLRKCQECLDDCCCVPEEWRKCPYYKMLYGSDNAGIRRIVSRAIERACDPGVDIEVEPEDRGTDEGYTRGRVWGSWANIHLCPRYFRLSASQQVGLIVHEMTHYGGATDGPPEWQDAHTLDNALPWLARVSSCK